MTYMVDGVRRALYGGNVPEALNVFLTTVAGSGSSSPCSRWGSLGSVWRCAGEGMHRVSDDKNFKTSETWKAPSRKYAAERRRHLCVPTDGDHRRLC